jgi:hypothetical protein
MAVAAGNTVSHKQLRIPRRFFLFALPYLLSSACIKLYMPFECPFVWLCPRPHVPHATFLGQHIRSPHLPKHPIKGCGLPRVAAASLRCGQMMGLPFLTESTCLRLTTLGSLYFCQGGPVGLMSIAMPAWLLSRGCSTDAVGTFRAVASLPWALKIFVAPLMDLCTCRRFGF